MYLSYILCQAVRGLSTKPWIQDLIQPRQFYQLARQLIYSSSVLIELNSFPFLTKLVDPLHTNFMATHNTIVTPDMINSSLLEV